MNVDIEGLRTTALAALGQQEDGAGSGEVMITMTHPMNKRVNEWERIDRDDARAPRGWVAMKRLHKSDTLLLIYVICDARAVLEWTETRIKEVV